MGLSAKKEMPKGLTYPPIELTGDGLFHANHFYIGGRPADQEEKRKKVKRFKKEKLPEPCYLLEKT
jgi:hypothetical protein